MTKPNSPCNTVTALPCERCRTNPPLGGGESYGRASPWWVKAAWEQLLDGDRGTKVEVIYHVANISAPLIFQPEKPTPAQVRVIAEHHAYMRELVAQYGFQYTGSDFTRPSFWVEVDESVLMTIRQARTLARIEAGDQDYFDGMGEIHRRAIETSGHDGSESPIVEPGTPGG